MNSKLTRCAAAGTLAALLAANFCLAADYTAAPDGQTEAAQMAESMGLTSQWDSWKSEWENEVKNDWTQISLTPGSDASQLNFAWYSEVKASGDSNSETASESASVAKLVNAMAPKLAKSSKPKLIIGEGKTMKNAKVYVAEQETVEGEADQEGDTYLSNKVTATGLKANTTYYYSYQKENGTYTKPVAYTTKSTDSFSFIYVGDPQIGSSNPLKGQDTEEFYQAQSEAVCSDSFNWETTLNAAMEKSGGNASFVLSAGDQIQTNKSKAPNKDASKSEIEYAGYLSPDILKSLPVATTVGNHDADNANYTYHFNTPNNSELGSNGIVGGDYYFTYGSALFIMLNTQDTNVAEHKQFIEQTVQANPDCKWRIVTLHQDIYGSAEHSNEPEITNLRYQLVPIFEDNDIDVVLTGHDHAYSRSKLLQGGTQDAESAAYTDDEFDEQLEKDMDTKGDTTTQLYTAPGNIQDDTTDPDEQKYLAYLNSIMDADAVEDITAESNTVVNPEGILYMTANSSSGSKFYDLVPRMQTYIASRWQEDVPTYAVVEVTDSTFSITSYRTDNGEKIDE
ncbi:MAG: metallophosphoesterase, partial [Butyricicoccaceae bacterium]